MLGAAAQAELAITDGDQLMKLRRIATFALLLMTACSSSKEDVPNPAAEAAIPMKTMSGKSGEAGEAGELICESQTAETAQLTESFAMRVDGSATIDRSLSIRFVGVDEDSRCPRGVQCVWAGNAKVRIQVQEDGQPAAELFLNTHSDSPTSVSYESYVISLESVEPHPEQDKQIPENGYCANLVVKAL